MKVTVKLFALLGKVALPDSANGQAEFNVPEGTTPKDMMERLKLPEGRNYLVVINGLHVPPEEYGTRALQEGDALAVWPPIAGG